MKTTFLTGMIGFLLSLAVVVVSVLLPIVVGPGVSWNEALIGIVPGAIGAFVFLVVLLIGLYQMLNAAQTASGKPQQRSPQDAPSASGVLLWVAAILLVIVGPLLVGIFVPRALENRRLWLYQQGRVDQNVREIEDLERLNDPEFQPRLQELQEELSRGLWEPEFHREEYQTSLAVAGIGAVCFLSGGAILFIRWRRRSRRHRARPAVENGGTS